MKVNMLLSVVLVSGLSLFVGVTGTITNPPLNAAAEVGGQAIFNCASDLTGHNWYLSTTREGITTTGQYIVVNCVVQPGFTTHYDVDRPGGSNNICNLIINAITMQQAGVYTCSDGSGGLSAILTVIERNASITVNSQPETVEGDRVRMSYTVIYNTSTASSQTPTILPFLTWIDSDGNTLPSSLSLTANSVTSNISVTAGRQDIQPYTCNISYVWSSPSTGLSFANNTPNSVSNSPSTSTINVLYAPIISSITMSQEVPVCPGKPVKITCHATANPAPTFSWIGPDSRTYCGATIEAVTNGVYTCNASNVIRGSGRSDTKETTLNVFSETNESGDDSSENVLQVTTVAIVLGSLLAVSLAVNVVVIVFIIRGRSSLGNGMKIENVSNIGHQNNEEHNRNETEETSFPAVYQELSPTSQQSTIYAQLTK